MAPFYTYYVQVLLYYSSTYLYIVFYSRHKSRHMAKKRVGLKKIDVPEQMATNKEDDDYVKRVAAKYNLNRTQVKSIYRNLLEAPELINLWKQITGESQSSENDNSTPEMRVTRNLAK